MKSSSNKFSILFVYVSRITNSVLSFLITYIVTRKIVEPNLFGKYSYTLTIVSYITLFLGFGFNDALMNIVVNLKDKKKTAEFYGLGYIFNIFFGMIFSITFLIFFIYNTDMERSFLIIVLGQSMIFNDLLNRMAIASKKIGIIVFNKFLINLTIVIAYLIINTTYNNYLIIYFMSYYVYTNIIYFIFLKPKFCEFKDNYKILAKKVKEYGFNVYLGRMASMGTYDLDKIMIKMFSTINYVGFYNLGLSCISPITMFSDALMSVLFKDTADKKKLSKKIIIVNILWLTIMTIAFMTIGKWLFLLLFGMKYQYVGEHFVLFGILAFFSGLYVPFNNFLAVKGFGKYMRNTAFVLTLSNVIFNILLIPKYKMVGAIYATIISLVVDNIAHYYYYKKAVKELNNINANIIANLN